MSGAVVWLTGLPSSGKSTLAAHIARRLRVVLLDSDEVRVALDPAPDFSMSGRERFYRTLGSLAALLARQGHVVVVAATAHLHRWRDHARAMAPHFLEVFIDVPLEECRRRDAKGLYAAAAAGAAKDVPGAGASYEAPAAPDVVAQGGEDLDAVERIAALIAFRFPHHARDPDRS